MGDLSTNTELQRQSRCLGSRLAWRRSVLLPMVARSVSLHARLDRERVRLVGTLGLEPATSRCLERGRSCIMLIEVILKR